MPIVLSMLRNPVHAGYSDEPEVLFSVATRDAGFPCGTLSHPQKRRARNRNDDGRRRPSQPPGSDFASHETVQDKADEYVRGAVHADTVEGYFGIFKRGIKGIYQHCSEKHLHRYVAEFDFRYNNRVRLGIDDAERANRALKGVTGKRLTYRTTDC
jgi:hypothetical protein